MTYSDALRLLKLFQVRDYSQERPHLYVKSLKSGTWVRPKGMRILLTSDEIAIQDLKTEEWESIPFDQVDFGLW